MGCISIYELIVTAEKSMRPSEFLRQASHGIRLLFVAGLMTGSLFIGSARAESIRIVALGASNTAGKGVGTSAAWPAQLEMMLRAKGYDAQVANEGINGDDTSRMLQRVDSSVPDGTRVVVLEKAATNDRLRGINPATDIAAITSKLRARGIKVVVIQGMHGWANNQLQADGIHITEQGHAAVANRLVPLVVAAIGRVR
jgi:acyl-CoA thioesterase-1